MKMIIFLILSGYLISFSGCSEDTVTNSGTSVNTISGKIENWQFGSKRLKVLAYSYVHTQSAVIDTGFIDGSGNFSFKCMMPPDSEFALIDLTDSGCYNTVTVNPPDAKYSVIGFLVCDSMGTTLGDIFRCSDSVNLEHEGQTQATYIIIDRPCTVTGLDSCNINGNVRLNVLDLNYSKGWNSFFLTYTDYHPPDFIRTVQTSFQPQQVKWYFNWIY